VVEANQVYAKDLSNLSALVSWAADMQIYGSFSQRRPDLGSMQTCRFCGVRRRANAERCCNPSFATTQRAWTPELGFHQAECAERSNPNPFSKAFIKKFKHKRHGQNKQFKVRQLTAIFNRNFGGNEELKSAAAEMHVKVPDLIGIPPFAEKYLAWKQERQDRAARRRARTSRRINRALPVSK